MPGTDTSATLRIHQLAHDLRQPLRSIVMTAQKLVRSGSLVPSVESEMEVILRAAERQDQLLNAAVEYESAAEYEDNSTLPLNLAVQTACLRVEAFRKEQNGTIQVSIPRESPVALPLAGVKALEKVLHNALKFHWPQVHPEVEIRSQHEECGDFLLRICDNGIGIDPQFHSRVFLPFSRLNPVADFPGVGLSLATAQLWLASVGARLSIEKDFQASRVGTIFVMNFAGLV